MKLLVCTQKVDKNDPILGFFHAWLLEFSKYFERIEVICLEKGEYDLPAHVYVHTLGKEKGSSKLSQLVLFYVYFASILFRRPQYVFFHMGAIYNVLAAPFYFLRFLTRTKFYWWKAHGGTTNFEKIALFFTDRVYTPTEKSFPVVTKKKWVVGHAVDTHNFTIDLAIERKPKILFVGRIVSIKRLDVVIDIAEKIKLPVHIIGPISDPEYKQVIDEKIMSANLDDRVQFLGGKTSLDTIRAYQESLIVINPSETGSVDKVVLEAMACGTPVLALDETYNEILGQFGLTVKDNDPKLYVDLIESAQKVSAEDLRSCVVNNHSLHTLSQRIFGIK